MGWPEKISNEFRPNHKIRITTGLEGVWTKYQPEVGKVYDANYAPKVCKNKPEMAVIIIKDKPIVVRSHEFELVED